jgi:hypothetical protein
VRAVSKYTSISLISLTLISLEIIWTRIFSAEFFYTYAYLIISLAILGLGMGGLALRLFSRLNRDSLLPVNLVLCGLAALAGPMIVMNLGVRFSKMFQDWLMFGKLVLVVVLLSSAFFFGGLALARLFRRDHGNMPKLYMADLIGAGLGVLLAIVLMNSLGTQLAVVICPIPVLLAAFINGRRVSRVVTIISLLVICILGTQARQILSRKIPDRAPIIYEHWDAMAKIKMYKYSNPGFRGLNIDNVANSYVYGFDGNWDRPDSMRFQFGIAVDYLIKQFDSCVFLSLGAGGGTDVLQALQEGATEVHAVEVNSHINKMMLEGDPGGYLNEVFIKGDSVRNDSIEFINPDSIITLREFTGDIYNDPRVRVVSEDARSYIRGFNNKFDLIYSLSSNTWAALASGSFALAENYLFTKEAFKDYWLALSDSGFLSKEHQLHLPRIVGELMMALEELGVENYMNHFAVYDLPQMRRNLLLLSKRPLDDTLRYHAFFDLTPDAYDYIHLLYPAADSLEGNLINQIVINGWELAADSTPLNIRPCDDNRPFTAQLGLWKNFSWSSLTGKISPYGMDGFPLTQIIIIMILLVVTVLAVPVILIPYFKSGEKLKAGSFLYFFVIGVAYMALEVVLIQKYTFFVGPSVYAIATIVLTLLIASGIGSRFAKRFGGPVIFMAIFAWLIMDIFVFKYIIYGITGLSLTPRILITVLLVFPLGFFMGMPFPRASLKVKEMVDWGFGVNGVGSVFGAAGIIMVSINYGFNAALLIAGGFYLTAMILFIMQKSWLRT